MAHLHDCYMKQAASVLQVQCQHCWVSTMITLDASIVYLNSKPHCTVHITHLGSLKDEMRMLS